MCQGHESDIEKYSRWSLLRPKIKMLKSKLEHAKIENSKNPRLLSEESAEHPTLPLPVRGRCPSSVEKNKTNGAKHSPFTFAPKILGDSKGCSRASNIWCIFVSSMLNLKIMLQTIWCEALSSQIQGNQKWLSRRIDPKMDSVYR